MIIAEFAADWMGSEDVHFEYGDDPFVEEMMRRRKHTVLPSSAFLALIFSSFFSISLSLALYFFSFIYCFLFPFLFVFSVCFASLKTGVAKVFHSSLF